MVSETMGNEAVIITEIISSYASPIHRTLHLFPMCLLGTQGNLKTALQALTGELHMESPINNP